MGKDHPNPWIVLFRAAVFGLVMGAVVGLGASVILELVESGSLSENVMLATFGGMVVGLATGAILGLTLVVTNIHRLDSAIPRVLMSLMTIFLVGGLVGLVGVNAIQVASLFGIPAAIAVWIVYPYVVKETAGEPVPKLDQSN